MPIYEYNCPKCGKHFEIIQKISETEAKCPACETTAKRLMSQSSFALKGGGWYKDGYSSATTPASSKPAEKKTESVKSEAPKKESAKKDKCP
ncbi:MAG: zinc ribbon domain-containing protein [Deltaproteobacteria bacterium]|nr:zinc ribbon domain-containing protein [Deltaproteobacteria bacterium]MBI2341842.1 zinc ribbon domain-containing protein [Deltaproteobacteria bacterium]